MDRPPASSAHGRSALIDAAKGIAITLVALGHTNQGEIARGYWGRSPFGTSLNAFIYAFHMPAFFFLSGIFLRESIARRGLSGLIAQKARTLLYPFLLWSLLIPLFTALLATVFVLRPLSLQAVLLNLVTGNTAWFLPALFVAVTLAALLRRVPIALLFPATCAIAYLWPPTHVLAIDRGVWHLPFVVTGMALGPRTLRLNRLPATACLLLSLGLAAGLVTAVHYVTSAATIQRWLLPAGFYGTLMLLLLARALLPTGIARWATHAGQASLWIFLLAPFPQGFTRVVLAQLGCTEPTLQLLVPTIAAIALPIWLHRNRYALRLNRLFALPEPRHRSLPSEPM